MRYIFSWLSNSGQYIDIFHKPRPSIGHDSIKVHDDNSNELKISAVSCRQFNMLNSFTELFMEDYISK